MLIKDYFPDSERYFNNDCYLPNEVYDLTGLSYKHYYPEDQFSFIMNLDKEYDDTDMVVGISKNEFLVVSVLRDENEFDDPEGTIVNMQRIPINRENFYSSHRNSS